MISKQKIIPLLTVAALALPGAAMAEKPGNPGNQGQHVAAQNCAPGLAKKSPSCVAPGQAKKQVQSQHHHNVGDRVSGDYVVVRDPSHYGLDPNHTYYRMDGNVYQVDKDSAKILAVVGLASAILN